MSKLRIQRNSYETMLLHRLHQLRLLLSHCLYMSSTRAGGAADVIMRALLNLSRGSGEGVVSKPSHEVEAYEGKSDGEGQGDRPAEASDHASSAESARNRTASAQGQTETDVTETHTCDRPQS